MPPTLLRPDPESADPADSAGALSELLRPGAATWFASPPLMGVGSAWYGHVPFAMWLVAAARPRLIVELGTHHGVSYAAFCEAVLVGRLDAQCAAVDTWRGDEHAGFYDEAVFDRLRRFHDGRYGAFSRLLRSTFDEAASGFADGSIDLLHIDGCHHYEAARHDFETWRPKLSRRAIVLFHDTNMRERQFGVWRLWRELAQAHPHFEFLHEYGLGVLAVGPEVEGAVAGLCGLTDPGEVATIRQRFALSGQRCRAEADRAEFTAALEAATKATETERCARQVLADAVDPLRHDRARLRLIASAQGERVTALQGTLAETRETLADTQAKLEDAHRVLRAAWGDIEAQRHALAHKDLQIAYYQGFEQSYHQLLASTSWRVTRPLRAATGAIPASVRRLLRRAVKAGWWAATPWKLQRRLARRREIIALANAVPAPAPEEVPAPALPAPARAPVDRFSLEAIEPPEASYAPLVDWYDPEAPEVSIVVLNWLGADMTRLCVEHLWRHTDGHRYEIIVVDNGSGEAEVASLRALEPLARVIALGSNRFFGEANNVGVEAARGAFVCLLNNDAFVPPGWLPALRAVFEEETQVGAAGPRLLYPGGALQEAGALINRDGTVTQLGKGSAADDPAFLQRRVVDYVSAACVLLRRDDFLRVLGFDLAWDPAYYEDVDLCLKLRLLGLRSLVTPAVDVVHIENATSTNRGSSLQLGNVVAINRTKFLGRWEEYLAKGGAPPPLVPAQPPAMVATPPAEPRLTVVLYTPYQLTPGGGERYLLTIAEAFKDIGRVSLVTPQPISRLRLLTMAREFALALDQIEVVRPEDLAGRPLADLAIVLGNEIFPTVGRMGRHNVYICQFPFPFETEAAAAKVMPNWQEFELVLTYSDYVREYVEREARRWNVVPHPIEVLAPPVPMIAERALKRRGQILHVGRFFTGGHCKRQDAMIEAFRVLVGSGVAAELHLAGSTMPDPAHRAYYAGLLEQARGLPVHFHANCSGETLSRLYAESDLYWHATGVGADLAAEPHKVEHFGISVVEAMSARCIPLVFAAGGPASIVRDGVTGYHYLSLDELITKTRRVLERTDDSVLEAMRDAAECAAHAYDEDTFRARVRAIAGRLTGALDAAAES